MAEEKPLTKSEISKAIARECKDEKTTEGLKRCSVRVIKRLKKKPFKIIPRE
ncbi:hypothetical protein ES703_88051 [subsurface metagenome]